MGNFAYLIVNADDYGYSEEVSQGILDAAGKGAVTAVGIFATSPYFDAHVERLRAFEDVDFGIHLNLTAGQPLTSRMSKCFRRTGGGFRGNIFRTAFASLLRQIPLGLIEEEWDAQIRRCVTSGITLRFLNSHEHIHMLPPVYRLTMRLAEKHGIPNIRHVSAEWFGLDMRKIPRETILTLLDIANRKNRKKAPLLLGTGVSGKIDLEYLKRRVKGLRRGCTYELMCHPGMAVRGSDVDRRLLEFHDWDGELKALLKVKQEGFFENSHVRLIRYRDMDYG